MILESKAFSDLPQTRLADELVYARPDRSDHGVPSGEAHHPIELFRVAIFDLKVIRFLFSSFLTMVFVCLENLRWCP